MSRRSITRPWASLLLLSLLLLFFLVSALASRAAQSLGMSTSPGDVVWVEDGVPAGATEFGDGEGWNWYGSAAYPSPFSGSFAHHSNLLQGMHQHYFYGATDALTVNSGEALVAYVFLDPMNPPTQVMLQWWDQAEGWEHRAYWGANHLPWGADATQSRRYMGGLPATGQWVRLEVPAGLVGLEGRAVRGMAFTLYGGQAAWDYAGKVTGRQRRNVALASLGGVATASSTTPPSDGSGNYEPVAAINGDRLALGTTDAYSDNTFWRDGTPDAYPDWLQVSFQGAKTIDEIDVFTLQDNYTSPVEPTESLTFAQYGVTDYDVQYWTGAQWMTVPGGVVTGNNRVWRRFSFAPVTTSAVRVVVRGALYGRSRVVELEAWGYEGATPTPTPTAGALISIADASRAEGNSDLSDAAFVVSLSNSSSQTIYVDYSTADGTALSPEDYFAVSGTLTFLPGETTKTVSVPVDGDYEVEGNETFTVVLSSPLNAGIADGQAVGTITNDDIGEPALSNFQNAALTANGAKPRAITSTGVTTRAQVIGDGMYKVNTSGYWAGNVGDTAVVILGQTYKIAVVRIYFPQDGTGTPIEPRPGTTSTKAVRDFDVSYQRVANGTWTYLARVRGNDRAMVRLAFPALTDVKAIRVKLVKGGTDNVNVGKIAEVEAWRSLIPYGSCEQESQPDPCGLLSDLDWAMKRYVGNPPHPNWGAHLDWYHASWDKGSENKPLIAHAITLWKPVQGQDNIGWWRKFFDCQTGGNCTNAKEKLKYLKGSELFSGIYDGSVVLAIAAVHQWADENGVSDLKVKAERYLRATWGAYTLAAGSSYATKIVVRNGMTPEEVPNCQVGSAGPFFDGPFLPTAGMRAYPGALCQDDRGPLFNRAIERAVQNNKREPLEKKAVADYIQTRWGPTRDMNVYGLYNTECGVDGVLWKHVTGSALAFSYILNAGNNMLKFSDGTGIRTISTYRFLGWGGTSPVRVTVMEDNRNYNTVPTYAVMYTSSSREAEALFPWSAAYHNGVTRGFARLETVMAPELIRASNIDPADGDVANGFHNTREVTLGLPLNPAGRYHVVLSPGEDPKIVNW